MSYIGKPVLDAQLGSNMEPYYIPNHVMNCYKEVGVYRDYYISISPFIKLLILEITRFWI